MIYTQFLYISIYMMMADQKFRKWLIIINIVKYKKMKNLLTATSFFMKRLKLSPGLNQVRFVSGKTKYYFMSVTI